VIRGAKVEPRRSTILEKANARLKTQTGSRERFTTAHIAFRN
jgi:hypothetical protein